MQPGKLTFGIRAYTTQLYTAINGISSQMAHMRRLKLRRRATTTLSRARSPQSRPARLAC